MSGYRRGRSPSPAPVGTIMRYMRRRTSGPRGMLRSRALTRQAIASRIHQFKRVCQPFGFRGSTLSGTSGVNLVNVSTTVGNEQLSISTVGLSPFCEGGVSFGGALKFQLGHLANVSEITSLFDNYRIRAVKIDIMATFNSGESYINSAPGVSQTSTVGIIPTMHYTIDHDDATAPTNVVMVMENSYAKSKRMDRPFSIVIKPRAQQMIGTTAGASAVGGILPSSTWIDNAATNVNHYGLKFWVENWPVTSVVNTAAVQFICTYYLDAKNVV